MRDHRRDGDPVNPCRSRPFVPGYTLKRIDQELRIIDQVEQVIKPAYRVFLRPLMQFGLHPPYPKICRILIRPYHRSSSIH